MEEESKFTIIKKELYVFACCMFIGFVLGHDFGVPIQTMVTIYFLLRWLSPTLVWISHKFVSD